MGGVWCKVDKGQPRSYGSKGVFNSTISRWTDHVRHAYRKPKVHHRPPRPPQKPLRSNERLTISHPQLVKDHSSDGWRSATLMVPDAADNASDAAPVPPPRKKRKRFQDLARTSYSMDDLNRTETLSDSTVSLPDKYHSESCLESRSSSSTLVVTPVLETRKDFSINEKGEEETKEENKENIVINSVVEIEEEDEVDTGVVNLGDMIVPIEKETFFSSRSVLHPTGLGFIDKLSAISEVSTESGFDDRTELGKFSDGTGSVTSYDSFSRETGLNILAHIGNINNISQNNEINNDVKEKTALSKTEWLQNILKEDTEPYFMSRDDNKRDQEKAIQEEKTEHILGRSDPSLPVDHLHFMNTNTETAVTDNLGNKTPPSTPEKRSSLHNTNHSVLLELLQNYSDNSSNPFISKEESIFLTNTKTNIIYKSLSSDKLTDDYDVNYSVNEDTQPEISFNELKENVLRLSPMSQTTCASDLYKFNNLTPETKRDYSIQVPKLIEADLGLNSLSEEKKSNVVTNFDFKEVLQSKNYVTALHDLRLSGGTTIEHYSSDISNTTDQKSNGFISNMVISNDDKIKKDKLDVNEQGKNKESEATSRRSSISDSLHEFEMSIYDMLKESKRNRDSSDEDESLKTITTVAK